MEQGGGRDDGKTGEGVPGFTVLVRVLYSARLGPCMVCRERDTHENQIEFFTVFFYF